MVNLLPINMVSEKPIPLFSLNCAVYRNISVVFMYLRIVRHDLFRSLTFFSYFYLLRGF